MTATICGECGEQLHPGRTCIEARLEWERAEQNAALDRNLREMNRRYWQLSNYIEFDEQTAAKEEKQRREEQEGIEPNLSVEEEAKAERRRQAEEGNPFGPQDFFTSTLRHFGRRQP